MKTRLKIGFVGVLVAVGVFGIARLRQTTARLETEVSALRKSGRALEQLRDENRRLQGLIDQLQRDDAEAARAVQAELVQARREIAELERRARDRDTKAAERPAVTAANRDPEKALTRLEYFQNAGRATPGAAFQTLVWAAMKGDDAALASVCHLDDAARQKAQALLATLPDEAKQKFPTPESLAALAVTEEMMKGTAIHISAYTPIDPSNTLLTVRTGENGREVKMPMRRGVDGWQFVVPERAIDGIRRRMSEQAPLAAGKK